MEAFLLRDRIISSHFAGKLNSLDPLPPPTILKYGGLILLNAYMRAMHVDHLPHTIAVPVAMVRSPAHESGTLDTVEIASLIPDDQRLFTPSAQVTPMTCKKAVFACLDTDVTFTTNRVLNFDCGETSGRLCGKARAGNERGAKWKVRIVRTFATILNRPLPPPS